MHRLMSQVKKDASGCWLWTGPVNEWGYGYFAGRGDGAAHRAMWRLLHGRPAKGMRVCHTCDVRLCCNPDHLWLGTQQDNIKDCSEKRRHTNGAKTHCPRGHDYSVPGNVRYTNAGNGRKRRQCIVCCRIRQRLKSGWSADEATLPPATSATERARRGWAKRREADQQQTR